MKRAAVKMSFMAVVISFDDDNPILKRAFDGSGPRGSTKPSMIKSALGKNGFQFEPNVFKSR